MVLIHMENMVSGCQDHLRPFRQYHGLQHIDHLRDTCHLHPVAVLVENIQGNARHQRVAHGILLIEEARVRARLHIEPIAPLIHDHANLLLRVVPIHDRAVTLDQFFHIKRLRHGRIPNRLVKLRGAALVVPSARMHIIMKGQAVHVTVGDIVGLWQFKACLKHALRPEIISYIRTAADLLNGGRVVVMTHISLISSVQVPVILGRHAAAASPVFIAHAEIINLPRFFMPVFLAQIRHRGNAVKGHVLHPLAHLLHRAAAHISVYIGFTAKLFAELKKFVRTETVVLHHTAPVGVDHLLARLLRTDAVLPVVLVRKTAARPAQHRDLHFLQRAHHILTHPVHVRNIGIFAHIQPFVDTSAQMLRKMSVDLRVDVPLLVFFVNK